MSSAELGYRLGYAAFPLILLAGAAYLGWRMGRKRQPPRFVAWPVGAAAALLLLSMLTMKLTKQAEPHSAASAQQGQP